MYDTQAWWQSKTIWASLVGILSGLVAVLTHNRVQVLPEDQQQIVSLIADAVTVISGMVAVYGRATATAQITGDGK